jgi:hypothetical protein
MASRFAHSRRAIRSITFAPSGFASLALVASVVPLLSLSQNALLASLAKKMPLTYFPI